MGTDATYDLAFGVMKSISTVSQALCQSVLGKCAVYTVNFVIYTK